MMSILPVKVRVLIDGIRKSTGKSITSVIKNCVVDAACENNIETKICSRIFFVSSPEYNFVALADTFKINVVKRKLVGIDFLHFSE